MRVLKYTNLGGGCNPVELYWSNRIIPSSGGNQKKDSLKPPPRYDRKCSTLPNLTVVSTVTLSVRSVVNPACTGDIHAMYGPKWVVPLMCEAAKYRGGGRNSFSSSISSSLAAFEPSHAVKWLLQKWWSSWEHFPTSHWMKELWAHEAVKPAKTPVVSKQPNQSTNLLTNNPVKTSSSAPLTTDSASRASVVHCRTAMCNLQMSCCCSSHPRNLRLLVPGNLTQQWVKSTYFHLDIYTSTIGWVSSFGFPEFQSFFDKKM